MQIPKEIAEKMRKVNELNNEIAEWITSNLDTDGIVMDRYFWNIVPEPNGESQTEDDTEYCNQRSLGIDWYAGEYYWKLEGESNYLEAHYEL